MGKGKQFSEEIKQRVIDLYKSEDGYSQINEYVKTARSIFG